MTAKIKLNAASGGGSVSIQAPSSSSNNRVIALPDIADGTLVTSQSTLDATKLSGNLPALNGSALTNLPAGGKVLQMLHFRKGDHASSTITGSSSGSNDWNYTAFSFAITPSATTSKIMLVGHMSMGGDSCGLFIEVMINGSKTAGTANGDSNGSRRTVHTSAFIEYDRNVTTIPVNYVFSPNSTSQQTYNFRFNHDSSSDKTIYINRSTNASNNLRQGDAVSHVTLLEIGA